jgi:hypothetical protein
MTGSGLLSRYHLLCWIAFVKTDVEYILAGNRTEKETYYELKKHKTTKTSCRELAVTLYA